MADFSGIKTPAYFYDLDLLKKTLGVASREADRYGYRLHYAIKANNNPVILRIIREYGYGTDCVSGNEMLRALETGFTAGGMVLAGVGKTDVEIELAIKNDIFCINCESLEELEVASKIAGKLKKIVRVALRVNPSIKADTHRYITTGGEENKFGIVLPQLRQALDYCKNSAEIEFTGLHFHIGSQITSLDPFKKLCETVNRVWREFDITDYSGKMINLGGGYGIDYKKPETNSVPDFGSFFSLFAEYLELPRGTSVHFELGRSLVGQCGRILTRVLYTKQGAGKKFVIVDAGMTELIRPALYQAVHRIINVSSPGHPERYDVVGPVCESSDVFAKDIMLPRTLRGDMLHILSCGAYTESMNMNFNLREKPGSVYFSEGKIVPGEE